MRKTGLLPSEMSPRVSCGEGVVLACCHSCSDQTAPGPLCPRPAGAGLFRLCLGSGLLGGNIMGGERLGECRPSFVIYHFHFICLFIITVLYLSFFQANFGPKRAVAEG